MPALPPYENVFDSPGRGGDEGTLTLSVGGVGEAGGEAGDQVVGDEVLEVEEDLLVGLRRQAQRPARRHRLTQLRPQRRRPRPELLHRPSVVLQCQHISSTSQIKILSR